MGEEEKCPKESGKERQKERELMNAAAAVK